MSGPAPFSAHFLREPAFAVFEPAVRERLCALSHFPAPQELRRLTVNVQSFTEPWFDFVLQNDAALQTAGGFDAFIAKTCCIPTRSGSFHDVLGALVWLHFPTLKTAIHRLQLAAASNQRGPRENAATHLDESGVLVVSTDEQVFRAIAELSWRELFWEQRAALMHSTRFISFGHGMLDAFRAPHPGLMAKALCVRVSPTQLGSSTSALRLLLDAELARLLPDFLQAPARLLPLPVLGVPGWVSPQHAAFYEDEHYFRAQRARSREPSACCWLELG